MKTVLALTAASVIATALLLASQPDPMTTSGISKGGRSPEKGAETEVLKPGAPLDRY